MYSKKFNEDTSLLTRAYALVFIWEKLDSVHLAIAQPIFLTRILEGFLLLVMWQFNL